MEISQIEVSEDEVMERLSDLGTTKSMRSRQNSSSSAEGVQRANSTLHVFPC